VAPPFHPDQRETAAVAPRWPVALAVFAAPGPVDSAAGVAGSLAQAGEAGPLTVHPEYPDLYL